MVVFGDFTIDFENKRLTFKNEQSKKAAWPLFFWSKTLYPLIN